MAVSVRLDLVALGDEALDKPGKRLCDPTLDEERRLDTALVEHGEHAVDVPNHAFRDWRVIVDARLVPVLDVDREGCERSRPALCYRAIDDGAIASGRHVLGARIV